MSNFDQLVTEKTDTNERHKVASEFFLSLKEKTAKKGDKSSSKPKTKKANSEKREGAAAEIGPGETFLTSQPTSKLKNDPKPAKKKKTASSPDKPAPKAKAKSAKTSSGKPDTESPEEKGAPLQLDQVEPPVPPEPRTIPSKYLPLDETRRQAIREELTNRRTETLIRRLLDTAQAGLPAGGDRREDLPGLTALTDNIRGIGDTPADENPLTPEKLVQSLTRLGQALQLPFHVTPLISEQEILDAA